MIISLGYFQIKDTCRNVFAVAETPLISSVVANEISTVTNKGIILNSIMRAVKWFLILLVFLFYPKTLKYYKSLYLFIPLFS